MRITLSLMPLYSRESPSLAIAYLASHLKQAGNTVNRLEFNLRFKNKAWISMLENNSLKREFFDNSIKRYMDHCIKTIIATKPDIVGFSVYSSNVEPTKFVAKSIKELNPNIKIVFGGPFSLIEDCRSYLMSRITDYILIGEGEKTFPKLVEYIEKDESYDIPGVMSIKDGKVKYLEWIPDNYLDSLEFPKFLLEDLKNSEVPWRVPMSLSRGCLYNCSFCTQKKLWKGYRQRSADNVIKEIKHHISNLGIKSFRFNDSLINMNTDFLKYFCESLIDENLHVKWGGNFRIDRRIDKDMFILLQKAGCNFIYFGLESGSDKVLKSMNKDITTDIIIKNIRDAHESEIWVHGYFMVGFPSETEVDLNKTVQFIKKNKKHIDSFMVNAFQLDSNAEINNIDSAMSFDYTESMRRLEKVKSIFNDEKYYYLLIDKPYQARFDRVSKRDDIKDKIYL